MKRAIEIAKIMYPKSEGWRHVWVFDHSSCHAAMADDALDVGKLMSSQEEYYESCEIQFGMGERSRCFSCNEDRKWPRE